MSKKLSKISKYLSYILRHKPDSIGLSLDNEGWADIDELIAKTNDFQLTKEIIEKVTLESDKQRFIIKKNKIRANQGHSINIDLKLPAKKPPKILYHGTAMKFLENIYKEGLKPQKRQYVHLSTDKQTAIKVGERHGKPIVLEINSLQMYEEGCVFYLSENGVWLTDNVSVTYIKKEKKCPQHQN